MSELRLYDYFESGNAYKVRLLLTLLGQPFERVHLDILKGETKTPEYLTKTPVGRVPMLEWPDGRRCFWREYPRPVRPLHHLSSESS